jgi:hypothetical protein
MWDVVVAYAGAHGLSKFEEELLASDRVKHVDASDCDALCFDSESDEDNEASAKRQRTS